MATATLGKVSIEADALQTRHIYATIASGGAAQCGCAYCRNYTAQLPSVFPQELIEFFEICGIDIYKDAEVYEMGGTRPGFRLYGGEYYFISKSSPAIDADDLPNGFKFTITAPSPLAPDEFINAPGACCLNFLYEMPWVLDESP